MKRFGAFFFLLVILSVAIHPVVAMHFCGDKIKSLHLYPIENNHSCCHTQTPELSDQNTITCCSAESNSENQLPQLNNYCCDFEVAQLSTGDFQNPQQQNTMQVLMPTVYLLLLTIFEATDQLSEIDSLHLKNTFPPDGLFFADVDIRNYICIYRI